MYKVIITPFKSAAFELAILLEEFDQQRIICIVYFMHSFDKKGFCKHGSDNKLLIYKDPLLSLI